jgi:hypothetical protein
MRKPQMKKPSEKFAWGKDELVIEKKPDCQCCGSSARVISTFIGPDDPPGKHNYGDVVSPGQVFHSHWCTVCDQGVGESFTLPSLAARPKPKP